MEVKIKGTVYELKFSAIDVDCCDCDINSDDVCSLLPAGKMLCSRKQVFVRKAKKLKSDFQKVRGDKIVPNER